MIDCHFTGQLCTNVIFEVPRSLSSNYWLLSIIAILAGMLLPALSMAKEKAKQVKCTSNMRQIGIGTIMYADDNEGHMPLSNMFHDDPDKLWIRQILPYVGNSDEVRACPSDKKSLERISKNGTSYPINDWTTQ